MNLLYHNIHIRQCENRAYATGRYSEDDLMQAAAAAAFRHITEEYSVAEHLLVVCGLGNNGGDGLVLATLAKAAGMKVTVAMVAAGEMKTAVAARAYAAAVAAEVNIMPWETALSTVESATVIVDAILGIGIRGELAQSLASCVAQINQLGLPVVSLDVPTGLDSDTGHVESAAIHAALTVTFIAAKVGLFTGQGPAFSGNVVVADLGVADCLPSELGLPTLSDQDIQPLLRQRRRDAHKGDHGHVLVIGGDYGMGGAVRMAAEAALRAGAGLVSVATRPEHVPVVSGSRPEIMCHQVREPDELVPLLDKSNVVVIGPGLGQTDWAKGLLSLVLSSSVLKVIDADGLNLLSETPQRVSKAILTPHPGEAARLLGVISAQVQQDRVAAVRKIAAQYDATTLLKGAGTLISTTAGELRLCLAGNPGMATGGMGDVLSGVVGGLLSQGLSLTEAAHAGVLIHAKAGDYAAAHGGERGLLASDLLGFIRSQVNPDDR